MTDIHFWGSWLLYLHGYSRRERNWMMKVKVKKGERECCRLSLSIDGACLQENWIDMILCNTALNPALIPIMIVHAQWRFLLFLQAACCEPDPPGYQFGWASSNESLLQYIMHGEVGLT